MARRGRWVSRRLIEVHNEAELARALRLDPPVVGINNRNLADFTVTLETTRRLRPLVPPGCLVVSESGIRGAEQMREMAALGVDAVLVGEALVTAPTRRQPCCALAAGGTMTMSSDDGQDLRPDQPGRCAVGARVRGGLCWGSSWCPPARATSRHEQAARITRTLRRPGPRATR